MANLSSQLGTRPGWTGKPYAQMTPEEQLEFLRLSGYFAPPPYRAPAPAAPTMSAPKATLVPMHMGTQQPVPTQELNNTDSRARALDAGIGRLAGFADMFAVNPQMRAWAQQQTAEADLASQQANFGNENRNFWEKSVLGALENAPAQIPQLAALFAGGPAAYALAQLGAMGPIYSGTSGTDAQRLTSTLGQTALEMADPSALVANVPMPWYLKAPAVISSNIIAETAQEYPQKVVADLVERGQWNPSVKGFAEETEAVLPTTTLMGVLGGGASALSSGAPRETTPRQAELPLTGGSTPAPVERRLAQATVPAVATARHNSAPIEARGSTTPVHPNQPDPLKLGGYAVAVRPEANKRIPGSKVKMGDIKDYIAEEWEIFGNDPALYVGTWYDTREDMTHLDASAVVQDLDTAMLIAKRNGEKAIFDIANKREIRVPFEAPQIQGNLDFGADVNAVPVAEQPYNRKYLKPGGKAPFLKVIEDPATKARLMDLAQEGQDLGRNWWDTTGFAMDYGQDWPVFAQMWAAANQRNTPGMAFKIASQNFKYYKDWQAAGADPTKIDDFFPAKLPAGYGSGNLGAIHRNMIRIAQGLGMNPSEEKLTSMYPNIMGDFDPVTIDRWIARALYGPADWKTMTDAEGNPLPEGLSQEQYGTAEKMMQAAAAEAGMSPAAFQASVWVGAMRRALDAGWRGAKRDSLVGSNDQYQRRIDLTVAATGLSEAEVRKQAGEGRLVLLEPEEIIDRDEDGGPILIPSGPEAPTVKRKTGPQLSLPMEMPPVEKRTYPWRTPEGNLVLGATEAPTALRWDDSPRRWKNLPVTTADAMVNSTRYLEDATVEHITVALIKDGKVVKALTSSDNDTKSASMEPILLKVRDAVDATGATEVRMVHNHPSGVDRFSDADKRLAVFMRGLLGPKFTSFSVVAGDTGKAAHLGLGDLSTQVGEYEEVRPSERRRLKGFTAHPELGTAINSPEDVNALVTRVAKQTGPLDGMDGGLMLFRDGYGRLVGIETATVDELKDPVYIKARKAEHGGDAIIYAGNADVAWEIGKTSTKLGVLDVVGPQGTRQPAQAQQELLPFGARQEQAPYSPAPGFYSQLARAVESAPAKVVDVPKAARGATMPLFQPEAVPYDKGASVEPTLEEKAGQAIAGDSTGLTGWAQTIAETTREDWELAKGGVIPHATTKNTAIDLAARVGFSADEVAKILSDKDTASPGVAAQGLAMAATTSRVNLARAVTAPDVQTFAKYLADAANMLVVARTQASEAGRALGHWGWMIREGKAGEMPDVMEKATKAARDFLAGKETFTTESIIKALGGEQETDFLRASLYYGQQNGTLDIDNVARAFNAVMASNMRQAETRGPIRRVADMPLEWFRISILTGPATHEVNLTSTGLNVAMHEKLVEPLASMINWATGAEDQPSLTQYRKARVNMGLTRSLADVAALSRFGFLSEYPASQIGHMAGMNPYQQQAALALGEDKWRHENTPALPGAVGRVARSVGFGTLGAEDAAIKALVLRNEIAVQMEMAGMEWDGVSTVPADIMSAAMDKADRLTFNERLGEWTSAINKGVRGSYVGSWVVPFTRTMTNIIKTGATYTPGMNLLVKAEREALATPHSRAQNEALARLSVGAGLMGLVAMLRSDPDEPDKYLTAPAPKNANLRNIWYLENGNLAMRFPDGTQHEIYRMEPLNIVLGSMIGAVDAINNEDADASSKVATAAMAMVKAPLSAHFLVSVADMVDAAAAANVDDDPLKGRRLGQWFARTGAAMTVPQLAAQAAQYHDMVMRKPDPTSYSDQVKARLPGLRETLPPRLDVRGQETPEVRSGALFPAVPTRGPGANDPLAKQLLKWDKGLGYPKALEEMSIDQQKAYLAHRWKTLNEWMPYADPEQFESAKASYTGRKATQELRAGGAAPTEPLAKPKSMLTQSELNAMAAEREAAKAAKAEERKAASAAKRAAKAKAAPPRMSAAQKLDIAGGAADQRKSDVTKELVRLNRGLTIPAWAKDKRISKEEREEILADRWQMLEEALPDYQGVDPDEAKAAVNRALGKWTRKWKYRRDELKSKEEE